MNSNWQRLLAGPMLVLGILWTACDLTAQTSADKKEKEKHELQLKAEGMFVKGDIEGCFKALQDWESKDPTAPPARLQLARYLIGNQQTVQAGRQLLEVAIVENPDHPEVYLSNGSIALAEGRITDAVLNCQIALQLSEGNRWSAAQRKTFQREARAGLATSFEARKDWTSARTQFAAWSELEPKNGQLRQRMARALFLTGKTKEAFAELETSAADDKTLEPPEVTMGLLYSSIVGTEDPKKKDKDKEDFAKLAEEWFKKADAKFPDKIRVKQAYAGWLLDSGKLKEAGTFIDDAVKLDGKTLSRETKALQGLQERYKGNWAAAEKIFEDLLRLQPADFFSSNQLALVLIEQDDPSQQRRAVQLAEVNARQYPRSAEAFATLGWVYFKSGRVDEADRTLGTATNSGQASADTAYYLGKLLAKKEMYNRAKEVLDKALETKGVFVNRERAKDLLAEIKPKVKDEPKEKEKDKEPKAKESDPK